MDLHIHSNLSTDGVYSVEEILQIAQKSGVDGIAITDHNTALAHLVIEQINKDKYFNGKIISGIEIDVVEDGIAFEILGYDFDVFPVAQWAYEKFGTTTKRQTIIRNKLFELCDKNGIKYDKNFEWNSKQEFAHINVFRNLERYPENKLKLKDIQDGSDFYRNSTTNKNFILYLDMSFLWASVDEVKNVIGKNGGKTILAHPYGYKANLDVEKLLQIVLKYNLDGVEVYHPKHTEEQIKYLENFCNTHNLLISGGSDFHGKENEKMATNLCNKLWVDSKNK